MENSESKDKYHELKRLRVWNSENRHLAGGSTGIANNEGALDAVELFRSSGRCPEEERDGKSTSAVT